MSCQKAKIANGNRGSAPSSVKKRASMTGHANGYGSPKVKVSFAKRSR